MKAYWPEPPPDHAGEAEEVDRQEPPDSRRRPGLELVEDRQGRDGADQDHAHEGEEDRAEQTAGRHHRHGQARVAGRHRLGVEVPGQQGQPELGRLRLGQVGQLAVRGSRSGNADPQLRHAEQAREQRADDVDGLDAGQREAVRVLPDQPRLYAQRVPLESPARHHPVHVAVDGGDQRDHDEVVRLGRPVLRLRVHGGDEEQEDQGGREAADACHRRQRVEAAPPVVGERRGTLVGRHMPAAIDSPSSVSRSRSRAASAASSPGMRASLAAAAVCSLTVDRWKSRSMGPAVTSTNCILP